MLTIYKMNEPRSVIAETLTNDLFNNGLFVDRVLLAMLKA